jgi:hypothetical protein
MKTYRGSGCIDPHFLDLGTSWSWVVSFTPLPLYPRERAPGTHFIGGWVNPRAGLDDLEKWTFFTLPGLELPPPGSPARSQSLYRPAHMMCVYTCITFTTYVCLSYSMSRWLIMVADKCKYNFFFQFGKENADFFFIFLFFCAWDRVHDNILPCVHFIRKIPRPCLR